MLKAGFARVDMTPPLGTPLAGYYSQRLAQDVLDPLSLNAIAFSDGESTAVLITADMLLNQKRSLKSSRNSPALSNRSRPRWPSWAVWTWS